MNQKRPRGEADQNMPTHTPHLGLYPHFHIQHRVDYSPIPTQNYEKMNIIN